MWLLYSSSNLLKLSYLLEQIVNHSRIITDLYIWENTVMKSKKYAEEIKTWGIELLIQSQKIIPHFRRPSKPLQPNFVAHPTPYAHGKKNI